MGVTGCQWVCRRMGRTSAPRYEARVTTCRTHPVESTVQVGPYYVVCMYVVCMYMAGRQTSKLRSIVIYCLNSTAIRPVRPARCPQRQRGHMSSAEETGAVAGQRARPAAEPQPSPAQPGCSHSTGIEQARSGPTSKACSRPTCARHARWEGGFQKQQLPWCSVFRRARPRYRAEVLSIRILGDGMGERERAARC